MSNEIIIKETNKPQEIIMRVTDIKEGPAGPVGPAGADGKDGKDGKDGAIQYTAGTGIAISDQNVISATGSSTTAWGSITGTLSNQTDLNTALGAKADSSTIGSLASLTTTDKTSVVNAINEVNTTASSAKTKANSVETALTNLFTFTYKSYADQTDPLQITCSPSAAFDASGTSLTIAKNTDGSLAKIYGRIRVIPSASECVVTVSNTGLPTLDSPITLNGCALREAKFTDGRCMIYSMSYTINADGTLTIPIGNATTFTGGVDVQMIACLIVVKDFGDTPEP